MIGHTMTSLLRHLRAHRGKLEEHRRGGYIVRPWRGGAGYWYPTWAVRRAMRDGFITEGQINERGLSALQDPQE